MARFDGSGIKIVYTYAPETLISAGDFDALLKAKAEIDAARKLYEERENVTAARDSLSDIITVLLDQKAGWRQLAWESAKNSGDFQRKCKGLEGKLQERVATANSLDLQLEGARRERNELAEQLKECRSAFDDLYNHDAENRKRIKELEAQLEAQTVPPDAKLYQAVMHELAETKRELATTRWTLANEFDKRRKQEFLATTLSEAVDRITHERDEQAAIVADVDKSLAIAHKKIDEQKSELAFSRAAALNGAKVIAEYSDKCEKLELRSTKLNARFSVLRIAIINIANSKTLTAAALRDYADDVLHDDDELAREQERVCGAS